MPLFRKKADPAWSPPKARAPKRPGGRNPKTVAWIAILLGVGIIVVNVEGAKAARGKVTNVVFATTSIPTGAIITAKEVALRPLNGLTNGYATTNAVVGQTALHGLVAGEPIAHGLVAQVPERNGLGPNQVGFWLSVNLTTSGLVVPGDTVDVMMVDAGNSHSTIGIPVGQIIASDVLVAAESNANGAVTYATAGTAAETTAVSTSTVPAAVELAVTPTEALQLLGAEAVGTLTLVQAPWGSTGSTTVAGLPSSTLPTTLPTSGGTGTGIGTGTGTQVGTIPPTTIPSGTPSSGLGSRTAKRGSARQTLPPSTTGRPAGRTPTTGTTHVPSAGIPAHIGGSARHPRTTAHPA
jgi:Flp pilus assembly protein CpaB